MSTATGLLVIGCVLGGIAYGLFVALVADALRTARRKRARLEWRQAGQGRL